MGKENKVNVSCCGTLNIIIFLAFFIAKIFDKIDWSWWWVFSPLWIPIAVLGLIIGILILGYCIYFVYLLIWK